MKKNDSDYSESDISSSEDEEAEARIRKMMEEIFKHGNKLNTKDDIDKMADHCTNMLTKMKSKTDKSTINSTKADVRRGPLSGAGDSNVKINKKQAPGKSSQDEFMATLMGGPSLRDVANKKNEKPKFGDIYKEKLSERLKGKLKSTSGGGKVANDGLKEAGWRKKLDMIESDSSESSESTSSLSDDDSPPDNVLSQMHAKPSKKIKSPNDKRPQPQINDFEAAKRKAEEWLRHQNVGQANDGKSRLQLEDLSSDSDREIKSNLNRAKKNEELLKAKISAMSKPKASPISKKTTPVASPGKSPANLMKKPAANAKPTTLTAKRPVKK